MPVVVGIGNPLLDIIVDVDLSLLQKYNLNRNDAILAGDEHKELYNELRKHSQVKYIPGGATQNSVRCLKWISPDVHCTYMGCVGSDSSGEIMESLCVKAGVNAVYQKDNTESTGECAVCISNNGLDRSLVTALGAANKFSADFLSMTDNLNIIKSADIVYSAGFFATVSADGVKMCADICAASNDKYYAFNLSAPFLLQVPVFFQVIKNTLPEVDILFGNETEAAEISKSLEIGTEKLCDIASYLGNYQKTNSAKKRVVVITCGENPTLIYHDGAVHEYPIVPVKNSDIVDTNAAGDAYVGGFLAAFALKRSIADCAAAGSYLASEVIKQSGCSLPDTLSFTV